MDDMMHYRTDHSRERQLWCAVIERAVQDAIRPDGPAGTTPEHARQREEARRWFVENGHDYRVACDAAGFDPDFLRDRVLRMAEDRAGATAPADFEIPERAAAGRIVAFL